MNNYQNTSLKMNHLEALDLSDTQNIDRWFQRFNLWCLTEDKVTALNKTAFYLTMISKGAYSLIVDLMYPTDITSKNPDELHQVLQAHLKPKNYFLVERAKFHQMTRSEGESFSKFILRIQQQGARCDFGNQLSDQLRDRLVAGLNHKQEQRKLLAEANLTFERAKEMRKLS